MIAELGSQTGASQPALRRWLDDAISGAADIVFPNVVESPALARPEDVIAYVTDGYVGEVIKDARAKFSNPYVPCGFSAYQHVRIGECGVSSEHSRVYQPPAFPAYINEIVAKGSLFQKTLERLDGRPDIYLDEPVVHILHPQCRIYGHFLLEAVLKIPLIITLRRMGHRLRVLVPAGFPDFVTHMLLEILAEEDLFIARTDENYIFRTIISPHFNRGYLLSQAQIDWCSTLFSQNEAVGKQGERVHDGRLFLMRKTKNVFRQLGQIDEVRRLMEQAGFRTVFPETLSLGQQSRLFRGAAVIAGDYSSSLHNMIFSPARTKLISFNYINSVQTAIALSRHHEIAYIAPKDVGFIKSTSKSFTEYQIDTDELKQVLAAFC